MSRILVIDDQKDNLITIQAVIKLHIAECDIETALTGEKGIEIARSRHPDVILLDIIMPGMDGFETCLRLKENIATQHIPVIMITAIRTDTNTKVKALGAGADAFLTKPIDQTELVAQIRVALRVKAAEDKLREENRELETEIGRKENELELSAEKYKLLYQHSGMAIGFFDIWGKLLSCNEKAAELLGGKPEDFAGQNIMNVFGQYTGKEYLKRIQEAANSRKTVYFESKTNLAGVDYWFRNIYAVIQNENKDILGVQMLSEDITKKKEQENQLRESELQYRSTLHDLLVGVIVYDRYGKIQYYNPEANRILGITDISAQDLNETESWLFVTEDLKALPKEEYPEELVLRDKKTVKNKYLGIRKYGSDEILWVVVNAFPILNSSNEIDKLIVNFVDVSKHKKSQQIQSILFEISKISRLDTSLQNFLERVHFMLSGIMHISNISISLYNKNKDSYTIVYCADEKIQRKFRDEVYLKGSLTERVGKTGRGMIYKAGEHYDNLLSPDSDTPVRVWLGVPILNSETKEFMGVISIQDYENENAFGEDDLEVLELIAFNIGIFIERINNHISLKEAKEKAEESDRLKSAFLANMSHEIRTPLNGILGFSNLITDPKVLPDERLKYSEIIKKSGQRLMDTVNGLIDISKIEAGQADVISSEFSVNELVDEVHMFFLSEAGEKQIELFTGKALKMGEDIIHADRAKLTAILSNLVKNALKYTLEGKISISYAVSGSDLKFTVSDTGIGIPPGRQSAIFNRFEQADISDSRSFEGSGLGLSIVKGYLELMNGKIWLDSKEGVGSHFYFSIPGCLRGKSRHEADNEIKDSDMSVNTSVMSKVFLVAEDDPSGALYLKKILHDKCDRLIFATNGKEAIDLCRQHPEISLILMDIKMPVLNGLDATREIRKFNPGVRIIAQTAFAMEGDREKMLNAGCNGYIPKPIVEDDLIAILNENIDGDESWD